jgi:hypothetical protein
MILRAINQECEPHRNDCPSLEDVAIALQQLDGKNRTLVTLEVGDDHHMAVGGGGGCYVVYMTLDNMQFKNLVIPGKSGPKVTLTCGGQEGGFPPKQCVDLDMAKTAAKTFALTGELDPKLTWEDG